MYILNTSAKRNLMFTLNVDSYNTYSSVCHEARDTGLPLKHEVIPGGVKPQCKSLRKMHNFFEYKSFLHNTETYILLRQRKNSNIRVILNAL